MNLLSPPPPWTTEALCAQTDPELWFPDKGGSPLTAQRICTKCPVAAECLEWALTNDERIGVWGGTTPGQRRAMRREEAA